MTDSLLKNSQARTQSQPWLESAYFDLIFIVGPAFISSIVALLFKGQMESMRTLPLWAWVSFVLFVDVAHVYSSLFRTYLNKKAFSKHQGLLILIPLVCWAVGSLLYTIDALLFWRSLAYLAVFHFIRQQYGFLALYSRNDSAEARKFKLLDELFIYLAALYPLAFWHTSLPRNFNWFVEGDFVESLPSVVSEVLFFIYVAVGSLYVLKELILMKTAGSFNLPKNLVVFGTALSWWVAIVAINSDMSFTMVNVVSHGIPYMALVWLYQRRALNLQSSDANRSNSPLRILLGFVPAFLVFLCLLAYLEEGLWDGFIWREHLAFFSPFAGLPLIADKTILAILVPLLSLPQSTHYVLDGFIWRVKDRKSVWSA